MIINRTSRKNKYDDELEEYWCDKRTSGRQGLSEKEGLRESTSASGTTGSLEIQGARGNLEKAWERGGAGMCGVENPKTASEPA